MTEIDYRTDSRSLKMWKKEVCALCERVEVVAVVMFLWDYILVYEVLANEWMQYDIMLGVFLNDLLR
jgi:hypothetical protein